MIYAILFAIWRRVYGEGTVKGLLGNRAFQSFLCIVLLMSIYLINIQSWLCWILSLIISAWLTFQFWSRSVSGFLDCGDLVQSPDKYNRWFRVPLNWIYNKLGLPLYTGSYDWWYCTARYTLCLLPLAYIIDWWYLVPGLTAAPIYWGSKWIYEKFPQLKTVAGVWLDAYKNLAEIIHGFVFGLTVGLIGWGL